MVIPSTGWIQNVSETNQDKNMSATGILICHDNSYPFQERTLSLEQPIKIGRSVARARAANDNAIFDCKVLSRNHAVLWYDSGKFYLKDTKSSNGTFVNNKRLSPSCEESAACEVCSGDVVQFGVDVVESTKKVTHGCIVATLKLYLPDGKEAKASFSNAVAYVNVTLEDLYKLNQYIQEAGRRENALRSKLEYMQQLLEHTKTAANQSWKALVVEDFLLSRLEMLENQVLAYSKNFADDKLRIQVKNLIEDKAQYQNATKELLKKKVQEKKENVKKIEILKSRLSETEEETQSLHHVIQDHQSELQELAIKYIKTQQILDDTTDKFNKIKLKLKETVEESEKEKQEFEKKLDAQQDIEKRLQVGFKDLKSNSIYMFKQMYALQKYLKLLQDIKSLEQENNLADPVDVINIILHQWNSFFVEIFQNNLFDNLEVGLVNLPCGNDKNEICLSNEIYKNVSVLKNKCNKYVLPPISNKTVLMANAILNSKNKLYSADSYNHISNNELDILKVNRNLIFSKSDDNFNNYDNIASVKLIMKISNNKNDHVIQPTFNKHLESIYDCLDTQNICYSLSTQMHNVTQMINNATADNNKDVPVDQNNTKVSFTELQNKNLINSLKPLENNNSSIKNNLQEVLLKNLIKSKLLTDHQIADKQNLIETELQDLKNWLSHESNEVIIEKFEKYYNAIENETQQVQELNEQLVILKEKYNLTMEEKANIIRKYVTLESRCKDFLNTAYMISVYYVIPIMFALIWMLLEKVL